MAALSPSSSPIFLHRLVAGPATLLTLAHASLAPSSFARGLRMASTPVYARIVDDLVCVDPRTLQPGDDKLLIDALKETS